MIPITDAERRGWQRIAYQALGIILDRGRAAGLAPINWEIKDTAVILGAVPNHADLSPEGQRDLFDAWVSLLELTVGAEYQREESTALRASVERLDLGHRFPHRPKVVITATIWEDK